jgi:hypothetical protein
VLVGYESLQNQCQLIGFAGEKPRVDVLYGNDGAPREASTVASWSQTPRPSVVRIDGALDQSLCLKPSHHLGRHLHIGPRLARKLQLVRRASLLLKPPRTRQQYELDMRQLELPERRSDRPLPGEREMPQKESRAGRRTIRKPADW